MKNLLHLRLQIATLAAAGLLLQANPAHAQTVPPSPVGTWDSVISGSQSGLAILTFNGDRTISGTEILRPTVKKQSTPYVDPRYPNGDPGRSPIPGAASSDGTSSVTISETNFLGSAAIGGLWTYAVNGKIVGLLDQITQVVVPTEVIITNVFEGELVFTTNIVMVLQFQTNGISFRATVVPGKKLTLNSYGPTGNNLFQGVPAATMADMSGSYYATGKRSNISFVEFLNLTPSALSENRYDVTGVGPGYNYTGRIIVSKQKKIAFVMNTGGDTPILTVYSGSFNLSTRQSGTINGMDSEGRKLTYKLVHQ